jgi:hypothetical protein
MLVDPKWQRRLDEIEVDEGPVIEALKDTYARLERGWCRGPSTEDGEKVCVLLALAEQFPVKPLFDDPAANKTADFLRRAIGRYCIPEWNDEPERTKGEVLAAVRQAIDMARAERSSP